MTIQQENGPTCGLNWNRPTQIQLSHGGGGRMMQRLIHDVFARTFESIGLCSSHDSAVLATPRGPIAFTTDSYVVRPLFFPGGDIGKLAVFGTVNDLVMSGARPLYLSLGVILEEGFPIESLQKIAASIRDAAIECKISIVTGDTKVVEKGKGDGLFLNTSGVGVIEHSLKIHPTSIQSGDAILVSGDLGRHGISILASREGLEFETTIESDCAPLSDMVHDLIHHGIQVHCLRDLTRGGLASALNEIASTAKCNIHLDESKIPVATQVQGACEMLGLDPLYAANEGRMVAFIPEYQIHSALQILRRHPNGQESAIIGYVGEMSRAAPLVHVKSRIGISRTLDLMIGEQLPRIC